MTYPTAAVVTTNLDAAGDSPASARTDILDAVTKLNQIIAHTSTFAATLLDDTTATAARSTLGAAASGANTDITSLAGLTVGKGGGSIASNTSYGSSALAANTTGTSNTGVGSSALAANSTGTNNTALGASALAANTNNNNVAVGANAMPASGGGGQNVAVGSNALFTNANYNDNTALGYRAMYTANGSYSTAAVGSYSAQGLTTGHSNAALGFESLKIATSTARSVAVGYQSSVAVTTADNNTSVGAYSLDGSSTGGTNTAIGYRAGAGISTGAGNISIGDSTSAGSRAAVYNITTENNRISMGSTSVTNAYVQVAWTVVSDARDKTNFSAIPHGLAFVQHLNPIAYQFRESRASDVAHGPVRYGFKAQDVLALEGENPVIVDAEDSEKLRFNESSLIPVLVKAIQELKAEFDAYKAAHP